MRQILHLAVVSAVVSVAALSYWGNVRAQADGGGGGASTQELEVTGTIDALDDTSVTVGGVTYSISDLTEVDGTLAIGSTVKLEFVVNPDGSLTALEIETEDDVDDLDSEDELDEDEDEDLDEDEDEDQDDDEDDDEQDDDSEEEDDDEDDDSEDD